MYKISKNKFFILLSIIMLIIICLVPKAYAEEANNSATNEVIEEELERPSELLNTTVPTTYKTSTVNSISALPQANLNLNNILSFILIGIGIVNIILGIAILVSSKKN